MTDIRIKENTKELGKIKYVSLGYQDAMFGISIVLGGKDWEVDSFIGTWGMQLKVDDNHKWTEEDRGKKYEEVMRKIDEWITEAKVTKLDQLTNIPIEAEFDSKKLVSWRILTEVL